ncbi:polyprenol monophosphomannose synthase [Leucobacter tardus]|uniref:Polyprenol monophosphomannose synthase n=1 Tax=Leucobacter tardus TaxID=501483 RepID=A0A939QN98_9MICO|nr:polyprenol monophosphomannose synthase [Leucobacter tardus]
MGADALVILPTYNEVASLRDVVSRVLEIAPAVRILIVDDASPDGTGALADELSTVDERISVIHRAGKLGLGTAYIAGFRQAIAAGYHRVVEMDADGSHLPEELPHLLAVDADLVIGSRWIPGGRIVGWPRHRRAISRTGTVVARLALRSRLRDITSGYRVFSVDALRGLDLDAITSRGYGFQVEIAWTLERTGHRLAEVPITFVERASGRSKMTIGIVWEALTGVLGWGLALRIRSRRERGARPPR